MEDPAAAVAVTVTVLTLTASQEEAAAGAARANAKDIETSATTRVLENISTEFVLKEGR